MYLYLHHGNKFWSYDNEKYFRQNRCYHSNQSCVGVAFATLGVGSTLKTKQADCYKLGLSSQSLLNLLNVYSSPTSSVNWWGYHSTSLVRHQHYTMCQFKGRNAGYMHELKYNATIPQV